MLHNNRNFLTPAQTEKSEDIILEKKGFEPDVNRTRNLLIWSQTRYHCATDPLDDFLLIFIIQKLTKQNFPAISNFHYRILLQMTTTAGNSNKSRRRRAASPTSNPNNGRHSGREIPKPP